MSKKIFYNPVTNQILGMSDGEVSMEKYPYIEVGKNYHSLDGLEIKNGKIKVKKEYSVGNRIKKMRKIRSKKNEK